MKNTIEPLFIVVPPGLEKLCAAELAQLNIHYDAITTGGISLRGNLDTIYRCNLWLRCASRVLVRLDSFKCRDFPTLFNKASKSTWGRFITAGQTLEIRVSCRGSRLNHTGRIAATISKAAGKHISTAPAQDSQTSRQLVFVRLDDDICTISIDSSGELLHRRGYRHHTSAAPLRENLAAACLAHCNWHGQRPLHDPFCGSGTFAIEAALYAANIAPGLQRQFSFQHWPGFRHGLWDNLRASAISGQTSPQTTISAADICTQALAAARINAANAGVAEWITFSQADAFSSTASTANGLLICNPPYGQRLHSSHNTSATIKRIKEQLRHYPGNWHGAALLPGNGSANTLSFKNGGLAVTLYRF